MYPDESSSRGTLLSLMKRGEVAIMGDETLGDRQNTAKRLDAQRRIATALERIATAMEAQAEPKIVEEIPDAVLDDKETYTYGRQIERLNAAGFRVIRK
jgi:hypothetical protein